MPACCNGNVLVPVFCNGDVLVPACYNGDVFVPACCNNDVIVPTAYIYHYFMNKQCWSMKSIKSLFMH